MWLIIITLKSAFIAVIGGWVIGTLIFFALHSFTKEEPSTHVTWEPCKTEAECIRRYGKLPQQEENL